MKLKSLRFIAVLILLIAAAPSRADYAAGKQAYDRKDFAAALRELRPAANSGNVKAQVLLGNMHKFGEGVEIDPAAAASWYRKSAEQGYAGGQYNLGLHYMEGIGVPKDLSRAFHWFLKSAKQGLALAQFNVGVFYSKSWGVARDMAKAVRWYRRAAEQGFAAAQVNLGGAYDRGSGGLKIDHRRANDWYRKAAEQGDADAQYNLGLSYYRGTGLVQNFLLAMKWFDKAQKQKFHAATHALALMMRYGEGLGVPVPTEAYKYYLEAAEAGYAPSQYNLGVEYELGSVIVNNKRDYAKAIAWYRKAVKQNDAEAGFRLAGLIARGAGVPSDHVAARALAQRAARVGNLDAGKLVPLLADDTISAKQRRNEICRLMYKRHPRHRNQCEQRR